MNRIAKPIVLGIVLLLAIGLWGCAGGAINSISSNQVNPYLQLEGLNQVDLTPIFGRIAALDAAVLGTAGAASQESLAALIAQVAARGNETATGASRTATGR